MPLLDSLRPLLQRPLSPLGEAAIRAYGALPGVADWLPPPEFQPIDALRILEFAWPLVVLGSNPGADRILRKTNSGRMPAPDVSVIHAGALLTELGAAVEFPPEEKNIRTPDVRARWSGGVVDVE